MLMAATTQISGLGRMLSLTSTVAFYRDGKPFYGPFLRKMTQGDLAAIVDHSTLRVQSSSGMNTRGGAIYAFSRVTGEDLEREITLAKNSGDKVAVFYTAEKPYATPGGSTGPHAKWNEDIIPDGELPLNLALTIKDGEMVVHDKGLAQALANKLPKGDLRNEVCEQFEGSAILLA